MKSLYNPIINSNESRDMKISSCIMKYIGKGILKVIDGFQVASTKNAARKQNFSTPSDAGARLIILRGKTMKPEQSP